MFESRSAMPLEERAKMPSPAEISKVPAPLEIAAGDRRLRREGNRPVSSNAIVAGSCRTPMLHRDGAAAPIGRQIAGKTPTVGLDGHEL